jgi:hypothetical protein
MDILFPGEDVTVRLRGNAEPEVVRVEPFYSTQLKPAAKLMRPLAETLFGAGLLDVKRAADGKVTMEIGTNIMGAIFAILEDGSDQLIDFVGFAIGKPRDWFDGLPPDGLIELAEAVYRQNSDFFKQRILPKLQAWMPEALPIGAQSSQDSSNTATAAPTSTE